MENIEVKRAVGPCHEIELGSSLGQSKVDNAGRDCKVLQAEDFQKDGKPKVKALNALLRDDLGKITASERDGIWAQLIADGFQTPEAAQ